MDENPFRLSDGCGAAPGGAYISVGLRSGTRASWSLCWRRCSRWSHRRCS